MGPTNEYKCVVCGKRWSDGEHCCDDCVGGYFVKNVDGRYDENNNWVARYWEATPKMK